MGMHDDSLMDIQDLRFGYPGREPLFDAMSFHVNEGERVGVIGPTGSGKTTLFRLLVGLLQPEAGSFSAFGRTILSQTDHDDLRRHVGFLFQDSIDQLFCPTVKEDVAFGPLNLGRSKEEATVVVEHTLRRLGLADLADRVSYELSGGERRLVALATVLAMEPKVLLLDEPTTGLDPRSKRQLVEHLAQIGGTQVIASHDMEFVRSACRRVVVMHGGNTIADGPTDAILGDDEMMYQNGLEVPHSLVAEAQMQADHHHGAGPSHGHGHRQTHVSRQHEKPPGASGDPK